MTPPSLGPAGSASSAPSPAPPAAPSPAPPAAPSPAPPAASSPAPPAGTLGPRLFIGLSLVLTVAVILASMLVGGFDITLTGIFTDPAQREMFFISRVPRTLSLIFAAIAMSVSGVIMQRLTQNRFVEPTTSGTTAWAGLGLLLCLIYIPASAPMVRMVIASGFAFVGTLVFLGILSRIRARSSALVPLVGIMLGAVVGAATTFIASKAQLLQSMSAWRSGGFSHLVRGFYEPLWAVALIALGTYVLAHQFTVAGLGSDIAVSLGLNYRLTVFTGVAMVALAAGVTSVVVGFIPFLGLIVPNLVSMFMGDNVRRNLPVIAALATALVTLCDIGGRLVVAPMEIPASVILGTIGAVGFVAIVLSRRSSVVL